MVMLAATASPGAKERSRFLCRAQEFVTWLKAASLDLLQDFPASLHQWHLHGVVQVQVVTEAGRPVILDCGGGEEPISDELLRHLTVLSPNETELARLTGAHVK